MTEPTWKGDGLNQQAREEYWKGKTRFWENPAFKYLPEMRLLFKGGKLWNKNQQAWRNVVEQSLVEAAVAGVLAEQLHLPAVDRERLVKAALCHDWDKRLEKVGRDFTNEDRLKAKNLFDRRSPDPSLLEVTRPGFVVRGVEATFLEKLLFYVDDICQGSQIVLLKERIAGAQSRSQEAGKNLGIKDYWTKERKLGVAIESEIFQKLDEQGVSLASPESIPMFVKSEVERRYW